MSKKCFSLRGVVSFINTFFIFRFEGEHHLPHVEHHVGHFVPVGGHHEEEVEVVHHHGPTIEEDIHYIDNNDLNFIRPVR